MYIYTYCHIESIFILNFGLQAKFCIKKFCVLIKVSELCIIRYTITSKQYRRWRNGKHFYRLS